MTLPQPLPIRQVRVRVIGADGKPVQSAVVFSKYSRSANTDANGMAMLTTFQGFEDTVSARKEFDTEDENGRSKPWLDWKIWHATAPVQGAGTIQLRFEKWKRNGDRK